MIHIWQFALTGDGLLVYNYTTMDIIFTFITEFWKLIAIMSPYLLFGFFVSGVLSVLVPPDLVEKHLGGKGLKQVVKASLFGVPIPLCSCGVIPVTASLRKSGAGKGAATAFLLSTPQTGVDSIAATFSLLGPVFAVFRPVAALITGVIGGMLVDFYDPEKNDTQANTVAREASKDDCHCETGRKSIASVFTYGFVTMPADIGKPVLVGLVIAGLITVFVPGDFFVKTIGTGIGMMFLMMLAGIPMYVCATASVPIAAAMIMKGVSPGAALVFLMTGPATNAAAITTVWRVFGKRSALIYLGTVAACALVCGLILDLFFDVTGISAHHVGHSMFPAWFESLCGIALITIILNALLRDFLGTHKDKTGGVA